MSHHEQRRIPDRQTLYDALDIAAPDAAAWKQGYEAYVKQVEQTGETPQAYWDALDASAPDARRWKAAWAIIDRAMRVPELPPTKRFERPPGLNLRVGFYEQAGSWARLSEDALLLNPDAGVFGVFDGMGGGGGNPRAASQVAAEAVGRVLSSTIDNDAELMDVLRQSFVEGRRAVSEDGENGSTVATAIKLCTSEGRSVMGVAHAGDTRLFRYSKNHGIYEALTTDQSKGHKVFNGFTPGNTLDGEKDEYLIYPVTPGDRIMICSDGITGDLAHQFLDDSEFIDAFSQTTPGGCAERFYQLSKKSDDKSVVVIDIE